MDGDMMTLRTEISMGMSMVAVSEGATALTSRTNLMICGTEHCNAVGVNKGDEAAAGG